MFFFPSVICFENICLFSAWFIPSLFLLVLQPQLLEDELALKKKEQEDFLKMSECAEFVNPSSPNRLSKFVPYQDSFNT